VHYCKITIDRETNFPKGTGFVKFVNSDDAKACLQEAKQVEAHNTSLEEKVTYLTHLDFILVSDFMIKSKKSTFLKGKKSVLTPELASDLAAKFTLDGRLLSLEIAVDRKQADKLTQDRLKERQMKEDKRNTYLLYEGVIKPDSEAAKALSEKELGVRQQSFKDRKRLLSINPNLYISKTRLSIRNLPLSVDDKRLKKVGIDSVKVFRAHMKSGKREKTEEFEGISSCIQVTQVKVVCNKDRLDTQTGKPRSKGYAFLEFSKHAHALAFLRQVNNNPKPFGEKKKPIVEFAMENVLALRKRKDRLVKQDNKKKTAVPAVATSESQAQAEE
jgi:nucleolar protein 4